MDDSYQFSIPEDSDKNLANKKGIKDFLSFMIVADVICPKSLEIEMQVLRQRIKNFQIKMYYDKIQEEAVKRNELYATLDMGQSEIRELLENIPPFLQERVPVKVLVELPKPYSSLYQKETVFKREKDCFCICQELAWSNTFEEKIHTEDYALKMITTFLGATRLPILPFVEGHGLFCVIAIKKQSENDWMYVGLRLSDKKTFRMYPTQIASLKLKTGVIEVH